MLLALLGQHYGKLPHELLALPFDEWQLALRSWQEFKEAEAAAYEAAAMNRRAKFEAERVLG